MIEVQMISAAWCKRCHTLLPEVSGTAKAAGATFTYVDYDEMEDETLKATVTKLPTIRMRLSADAEWCSWTAEAIETWKEVIMTAALSTDSDF